MIAVICSGDGDLRSIRLAEKVLNQIVATQVGGFVVIVEVLPFSITTHIPLELERVVKERLVVDSDTKLTEICMNHGQSVRRMRCLTSSQCWLCTMSQICEEQDHPAWNVRIVKQFQCTSIISNALLYETRAPRVEIELFGKAYTIGEIGFHAIGSVHKVQLE